MLMHGSDRDCCEEKVLVPEGQDSIKTDFEEFYSDVCNRHREIW